MKNTSLVPSENHLQELNEELYKRNLELAIKNKTLTLLRSMYDTSLKTLDFKAAGQEIAEAIQEVLSFELVMIFRYDEKEDTLSESGFALSEAAESVFLASGVDLDSMVIPKATKQKFWKPVKSGDTKTEGKEFGFLLGGMLSDRALEHIKRDAAIEESLIYPLELGERTVGVISFSLSGAAKSLPEYQFNLIDTISNVVSLSLDKSVAYEALRLANERLQELDKIKDEFVSFATHQMRSPLVSVKLGLESILNDSAYEPLNDAQRDLLQKVYDISTNMANTVNDLLDVSKIEQGGLELQFEPFSIVELAEGVVDELKSVADRKDLVLSFSSDLGKDVVVKGDQSKLRQVIMNMVDNAIKYTDLGTVKVSVYQKDDAIVTAITDTGRGFSQEESETLFKKFGRGSAKSANKGGSGLGIYLAKKIIDMHNGQIWAESPGVNQGSTFAFSLPV